MSRHRDLLVAQLARELPNEPIHFVTDLARQLLRAGATLKRLAEAQCNGDYPADNGVRETAECTVCGSHWVPSTLSKAGVCQDCRTQQRVTELLKQFGMAPIFGGDPRGAVLKVITPSDAKRNEGRSKHDQEGLYVA